MKVTGQRRERRDVTAPEKKKKKKSPKEDGNERDLESQGRPGGGKRGMKACIEGASDGIFQRSLGAEWTGKCVIVVGNGNLPLFSKKS